jgi:hypothetical protein
MIVKEEDETFFARYGCLDCNRWQDKPELKRK